MILSRLVAIRNSFLLAGLFVLVVLGPVQAQVTAGASPGLNAALVRLFGSHTAFSAQLEIRMLDAQGRETLNAPMQFSLLDGKMRGELDVTRLKSKDLPALAATAAKSVGMDRVVTLVRPDKQETYLLYPAFQSCVVVPIGAEDLAALKQPAKIAKTPLGKDTIDEHACVKQHVVVTESDGCQHEATVWSATDLKDFPFKIQTQDDANTIVMQFRQVKFDRPAAKQFDLPVGIVKYDDAQALAQGVMKKLLRETIGK